MGALGGHLKHPYENPSLTFGEIKQIFKKINDGKMLVTEKCDGQNLLLSYSVTEGKVKAARNNNHLLKGGISTDRITELAENIDFQKSIMEAFSSFEETVKKLSLEEQIDIFGPNTNYYYNTELQDPNNSNVFKYDTKKICIHRTGHLLNNKYNGVITEDILADQFNRLEEVINKQIITENITDKFVVTINPIRNIQPLKNKICYETAMHKLQSEMLVSKMTDKSSLAEYILERMDQEITNIVPELTKEAKVILLKRLMKVKEVTAKNVYKVLNETNNSHLIEKVKNIIENEGKLHKKCISPIEEVITEYGAGVLSEFNSFSIKDPIAENMRIKTRLKEIITAVNTSNDIQAKTFINNQLARMKNFDNINLTCEGIVFKFNGDVYKMTGFFSPLNQILGMTKYQRGNMMPINIAENVKPQNKTAVISWGRFNPPTIGHEIVFKTANDLAVNENADFFIIPTKTVDKQKNPLNIEEKIKYLNKLFPEYKHNILNKESINTIFEAAKYLHGNGYTNLKIVVGSDRKEQFEVLKKYNNKEYVFENIEILSAGERLDEGESAASMSASKMREAAAQGDIGFFMKGIAGRMELDEGVELMNLIRSRIEVVDDGKKKVLEPISRSSLDEVIRKSGTKWCLFSKKKTKDGKRKKLGCYPSRAGAVKREKQVQYFKHIKEEQELEEMNAMSGGGVMGHVQDDKLEQEQKEFEEGVGAGGYNNTGLGLGSRYGISKRDDEVKSTKQKIKILFREEEQYMIDRKDFLEEIQLRKIIREGIKKKLKEKQENVLQEEQQLRLVIRKLLNEKQKDEPRHANTGINLLKDLLKTIVPSIEDDYKDLTTNPEQVKSFRAHLLNGVINVFKSADGLQDRPEAAEELTEQEEVDPNQPTDPRFIPIKKPITVKKEPVDTFTIQGLDRTGANVAKTTFRKIENKIKNTYENLTDSKDREMFKDYLVTNLKLHMDIFDNEMKSNVKEPSTPEYEKEKQKLDTAPEQTAGVADMAATEEPPPQM
jgi:nicotinic acid mononucleotide adenylyltransferase